MQMQSIVFITEKPSFVRALAPHIKARWPDRPLFAITTMYVGLYELRYPRGLTFDALPFIDVPAWKPRALDASPCFTIDAAGTATRIDNTPAELLHAAGEIVYASDPGPSGAIAYHTLIAQALGPDEAQAPRPAVRLASMAEADIRRAVHAGETTGAAWFLASLNAGLARRFFDFNFNANALALLGGPLRRAGANGATLSKYGLQLLYGLRHRAPASEVATLQLMESWPGTGRYGLHELGSPASRAAILDGLLQAGLLTRSSAGLIALAERGEALLGLLHPDCEDADLPARRALWGANWPGSRLNMERYLRTFFGKQKRFSASLIKA